LLDIIGEIIRDKGKLGIEFEIDLFAAFNDRVVGMFEITDEYIIESF
jgi:hypothetical protein